MIEVLPLEKCNDFSNLIQIGIPKFIHKHYLNNTVIGIYYIDIESKKRYYSNITHPDWFCNESRIESATPLFSLEKKLMYRENISCGIDLNFLYSANIKFGDFVPQKFKQYTSRYDNNELIPLVKLFEICETIFETMHPKLTFEHARIESAAKIDSLFYDSLYKTEKNKIVRTGNQIEFFYSDYNPYTITNRPTNSSGGINFTALSKKDDTRKNIVAEEGELLVQFDYSAFHPYLISRILNIEVPLGVDYYTHLNSQFNFSKADNRDKLKEDFFKLIYGYAKSTNPFSKKIEDFEDVLHAQYKERNSIQSFFLKRELFFKPNLNKNVLFNYFLQNMETEHNLLKIKQLFDIIPETQNSLILYVYDSFVFKLPTENINIVQKIEEVLTREGFPVKVYIGNNLQDLEIVN